MLGGARKAQFYGRSPSLIEPRDGILKVWLAYRPKHVTPLEGKERTVSERLNFERVYTRHCAYVCAIASLGEKASAICCV